MLSTQEIFSSPSCLTFSMFQMVVERLFVPELSKVDDSEKKLCAVAVTHLLCDPESLTNGVYFNHLWVPLLQALLRLFESSQQLQTMSATERSQLAQDQAEEDLIVGLDDTPGDYRCAQSHCSENVIQSRGEFFRTVRIHSDPRQEDLIEFSTYSSSDEFFHFDSHRLHAFLLTSGIC